MDESLAAVRARLAKAQAELIEIKARRTTKEMESVVEKALKEVVANTQSAAQFFLVWSPQGDTPPRYRHVTRTQAVSEAMRLAIKNQGQEFFVLQPISVAKAKAQVTVTEIVPDDDIPF